MSAPRCTQVNLKLFAPEPNRRRTVLLFVIRDKSKTPLSKLVEVLSEDVHKMWDTISKPPQYTDSKIDDFFEVGLPWAAVVCSSSSGDGGGVGSVAVTLNTSCGAAARALLGWGPAVPAACQLACILDVQ